MPRDRISTPSTKAHPYNGGSIPDRVISAARNSESAMNFITAIESRDAPFIARGFTGDGIVSLLHITWQTHSWIPDACPDRGGFANYRIPSFRVEFTRPTRNGIDLSPGTHPSLTKRVTINFRLPLQRATAFRTTHHIKHIQPSRFAHS